MVAFRQGFPESGHDGIHRDKRTYLDERAKEHHIVGFRRAELKCGLHGIDGHYIDVGAGRSMVDAVRVVDESPARFHLALEFIETLLVENYGGVIGVEHGA